MATTESQFDRATGTVYGALMGNPTGPTRSASSYVLLRKLARGDHLGSTSSFLTGALSSSSSDTSIGNTEVLACASMLALGYLGDTDAPALSVAARNLADSGESSEAHGDACVLWALATREVILCGSTTLTEHLVWLPETCRSAWNETIQEALLPDFLLDSSTGSTDPSTKAFQVAAHAVFYTESAAEAILLANALAGDSDAENVVATASALSGAMHGASSLEPYFDHHGPMSEFQEHELTDLVTGAITFQPDGKWAGNDMNAMLKRAGHGVVARTINVAHGTDFSTVTELRDWLDSCAIEASSRARFEVVLAKDANGTTDDQLRKEFVMFGKDHFHSPDALYGIPEECKGAAPRRWNALPFHPALDPVDFFVKSFTYERTPTLQAEYDGEFLVALHSRYSVLHGETAHLLHRGIVPTPLGYPAWLLIRLVGTDSYVTVPHRAAVLRLVFDHDGASVCLEVYGIDSYSERKRLDSEFQGSWARWLDDDVVLSDRELAAGVQRAEEFAHSRIANEPGTPGPNDRIKKELP